MTASFDTILSVIKKKPKKTIAVAMAEEVHVLLAIDRAFQAGIADAVLVGDKQKIIDCCDKNKINIKNFDIIPAKSEQQSVVRAIQLVRGGLADVLMKGRCATATLLKGVLDKDHGLLAGKILSHVAAFENIQYHKLLFMSDAAMNISPDLNTKISIIENAITTIAGLGITRPKIAMIAAVEKVNADSMPCTADAAIISKMSDRYQLQNAIIDGPLALDCAISQKSCQVKSINTQVGGDVDILIMPEIVSANVFYKSQAYFSDSKIAGIIVGSKVPIILTSRADSDETKFLSIALAMGSIK
jgi:phosphate butyryltransferase